MRVQSVARRKWIAGVLSVPFAAAVNQAFAQTGTWPTKPVRIILGYPPGGGADGVASDHFLDGVRNSVAVGALQGSGVVRLRGLSVQWVAGRIGEKLVGILPVEGGGVEDVDAG